MARLAIFLLFVSLAAVAQSPLERAVTLAREKRYAEAKDVLQSVPEPTPAAQKVAFHRLKAAVDAGLNDATAAASEMQQALAVAPSDPALLLATAVAEMSAGQLDPALRHAESAGGTATARAIVGDIEEKLGDFPNAIAAWQDAARIDPSKEEYRSTLAFALTLHQDFAGAVETLKPAIQVFPKSSRLRTLLGIAQYAMGDSDDAAATLSAAIAIDPAAEPAYRSLAQIVLESSSAPEPNIVNQLCGWNVTVCSALKLRAAREIGDAGLQAEAIASLERAP
ncbi:MAG TPA: tetratricopeptide repeat protein, partial [Candidatus Binataceae bacterium]